MEYGNIYVKYHPLQGFKISQLSCNIFQPLFQPLAHCNSGTSLLRNNNDLTTIKSYRINRIEPGRDLARYKNPPTQNGPAPPFNKSNKRGATVNHTNV